MAESIICRASSPFSEKTNFAKNWYFINPINSKGKTEYTEYGEIIDGWINQSWYTTLTPKTSFKLTDQGLLITPGADKSILHQIIDDDLFFNFLVGKYVTITVVTSDGDQAVLTLVPDAESTMETIKATFQYRSDYQILMYRWGGWLGNRPNIQVGMLDGAQPICLLGVCIEEGISSTFTYQDAEGKWRIKQPLPNRSLEMIKTNEGITKYGLQQNADIVGNPYFAHSYETVSDVPTSNSIGLETSTHWWAIKYFPNPNIGDGYGIQLAILQNSTKMKFRTSYGGTWLPWQEVYHNGNLNPDTIGRVINGSITIPEMENPEGVYSIIINSGINAKLLFLNSNGAENFLPFFAINGINKLYLPIKYGQGYTPNINFEWYESSVKLTGNDLRGPLIDAHLGYAKYGAYELKWSVIY